MKSKSNISISLIVNPFAGRVKVWKSLPRIVRELERLGVNLSYKISKKPLDVKEQAAVRSGTDVVVAVGGDGTVHHVANALVGTDSTLGVIPMGTGDDFAGHFCIPTDIEAACDVILNGRRIKIDVAKVGSEYFFTVAHVGLDAEVLNATGGMKKSAVTYTCLAIKTILRYRSKRVTMRTDRMSYEGKIVLVAIGNTSSYGRGMKITPKAKADDGLLDICFGEQMSKLAMLRLFPKIFSGQHISHKKVWSFRARRVSLWSESEMNLYGDGEFLTKLPADIEVVPSALWLMVPRTIDRRLPSCKEEQRHD